MQVYLSLKKHLYPFFLQMHFKPFKYFKIQMLQKWKCLLTVGIFIQIRALFIVATTEVLEGKK